MSPSAAAAAAEVAVDQEDGARQVLGGQAAARVDTEEATTGVRGPSEP